MDREHRLALVQQSDPFPGDQALPVELLEKQPPLDQLLFESVRSADDASIVQPSSGGPDVRRRRRRGLVLVAAAISLIGVSIALLLSVGGDPQSVDVVSADRGPAPTSDVTASTPPRTTAPSRVEEPPLDSGPASTGDVTASTPLPTTSRTVVGEPSLVPGFGTLTWTKLEGSTETLPSEVQADTAGGYMAVSPPFVWRSDDALSWTRTEMSDADLSDSEVEHAAGWEEVDLPEPRLPAISGIAWEWESFDFRAVNSGDVTVVPGIAAGTIPWEDYYGTVEVDCGEPEPCVEPVSATWNTERQTMVIQQIGPALADWLWVEPTAPLAELRVRVDGRAITFTDVQNGEEIHRIEAGPEYPAEIIRRWMQEGGLRGEPLWAGLVWVSQSETDFEAFSAPWQDEVDLLALPDGGFAAYDTGGTAVWTSPDGSTWTEQPAPAVLAEVQALHGIEIEIEHEENRFTLSATIGVDEPTGFEIVETWDSADGLTWTSLGADFPSPRDVHETDFGYVATTAGPQSWTIWVSADGATWEPVELPPGRLEPAGRGRAGLGGAGDVLWISVEEETSGKRTLWVGMFEQ